MPSTTSLRLLAACAAVLTATASAQFTTPNVITTAGDVSVTLGTTTFINHGLQGVGRVSAGTFDSFGESFGSISSLQVTNWTGSAGSYSGTFNILPDRGYNNNNAGGFFSDYAARIQQVNFSFTPYTGAANIGGTDLATKMAAQNQITITSPITGVKFTYADPNSGTDRVTTGLDPAASSATIFGQTLPYVTSYTGQTTPGSANATYNGINKLALDSEALMLKADGSGYVGDEYGANIYHFDAAKKIDGVIVPPAAFRPNSPIGTLNFISTAAPVDGRRNNQGFEGVSLSPDGTRLFALLQSGTIQDSGAAAQNRRQTRLLIYDVSGSATPGAPIGEYALTLPTYTGNGLGGAVNATAAQSEVVALDNSRFLVLSRDSNGQGSIAAAPSVFKSVLLVDLAAGTPTNFAGNAAIDAEGGKITTSFGVLDTAGTNPGGVAITALSSAEAINILNSTQLGKFNIDLDTTGLPGGNAQISKLTLGEKWEGMSLVPANDPASPNDYFLILGNDNDFLTSQGKIVGPDGSLVDYNGFNGYPATRLPLQDPSQPLSPTNPAGNDTMFLAYRVTIVPEPASALLTAGGAAALLGLRRPRRAR